MLVVKDASPDVECIAPHDHINESMEKNLPKACGEKGKETADFLKELIFKSMKLLESHSVNLQRKKRGKLSANCIWPWSGSKRPKMEQFEKKIRGERGRDFGC